MWQSKVANHNVALTLANDIATIPAEQFFACIGLTHVVVPEGVMSIGNGAFYSCLNLATISLPDSLASLGDEVFCASGLASITIPAKVGYIGHVFKGATRLHTVFFVADTQITSINHEAFLDCNSLENIEIPSGVKSIYDRAFSGCSSLESIEIPSSVTLISYEAFRGCSSLKSVTFGKNSQLELFGNFAFQGCSSLESIEIPFGVTSITRSAFYNCSSLESVTFEENSQLESIGDYAFFSCDSLTRIEIPSVVTSIGENAFRGCSSLTIYCKVPSKPSGWNYDWDGGDCTVYWGIIKLVADTQGINYVITINGASVVSYEGMETSIEILSQIDGYPVTEIKKYAFSGCDSLESVTFEVNSQLTNIGYKAFWGCDNLTSIVIPDSVTTIGNDAFSDCGSLIIYCDKESMPPTWSDYWHCFCPVYWYSKTQPITIGNWWHYVDGVVTKW